jgi:hypothetical protein
MLQEQHTIKDADVKGAPNAGIRKKTHPSTKSYRQRLAQDIEQNPKTRRESRSIKQSLEKALPQSIV